MTMGGIQCKDKYASMWSCGTHCGGAGSRTFVRPSRQRFWRRAVAFWACKRTLLYTHTHTQNIPISTMPVDARTWCHVVQAPGTVVHIHTRYTQCSHDTCFQKAPDTVLLIHARYTQCLRHMMSTCSTTHLDGLTVRAR